MSVKTFAMTKVFATVVQGCAIEDVPGFAVRFFATFNDARTFAQESALPSSPVGVYELTSLGQAERPTAKWIEHKP